MRGNKGIAHYGSVIIDREIAELLELKTTKSVNNIAVIHNRKHPTLAARISPKRRGPPKGYQATDKDKPLRPMTITCP